MNCSVGPADRLRVSSWHLSQQRVLIVMAAKIDRMILASAARRTA